MTDDETRGLERGPDLRTEAEKARWMTRNGASWQRRFPTVF